MMDGHEPIDLEGCRVTLRNGDEGVIIKCLRKGNTFPYRYFGMATERSTDTDYAVEWDSEGKHAVRGDEADGTHAMEQLDPGRDIVRVHLYPLYHGNLKVLLRRVPGWATHIAVDKEGAVFAYDGQPTAVPVNHSTWAVGQATRCEKLKTLPGIFEGWKRMCWEIDRQPWAEEFRK